MTTKIHGLSKLHRAAIKAGPIEPQSRDDNKDAHWRVRFSTKVMEEQGDIPAVEMDTVAVIILTVTPIAGRLRWFASIEVAGEAGTMKLEEVPVPVKLELVKTLAEAMGKAGAKGGDDLGMMGTYSINLIRDLTEQEEALFNADG